VAELVGVLDEGVVQELVAAVRFANAAGALACTKFGAQPSLPRRRDVEQLLADNGGLEAVVVTAL
ncbi:MAG: hypothetical protein WCP21_18075, partial [Armatimonadota bacterium]